ncbi:universal stress protein [Orrella marina]|uniref:UspA domain-containing protein n=1 Tax=Orrella marina TaxID=2163011 RepID=A0A2R4XF81_9BURK|nr:universal stress protein [Orrella marina]AWB32421.1 hypothetical protein DBV39_00385 [Orrella marina]
MSGLSRILIATDLSESSRIAVVRGLDLAQTHDLECTIVHVLPRDLMFDIQHLISKWDSTFERDAIERQTRELNRSVQSVLKNREINAHTRLRTGKPAEEIAQQARESQADLLVVSSHGKGLVKRLLVGSTTLGVLQDAPCPVLVVRTEQARPYQKALLAIDFSETSRTVVQLARRYASNAHLVMTHSLRAPYDEMQRLALLDKAQTQAYIDSARHQAEDRLHQLAESAGISSKQYTVQVLDNHSPEAMLAAQLSQDCDLIVTGKHGRHATRDRILGSFTQSILTHATCDVLVAQPRNG